MELKTGQSTWTYCNGLTGAHGTGTLDSQLESWHRQTRHLSTGATDKSHCLRMPPTARLTGCRSRYASHVRGVAVGPPRSVPAFVLRVTGPGPGPVAAIPHRLVGPAVKERLEPRICGIFCASTRRSLAWVVLVSLSSHTPEDFKRRSARSRSIGEGLLRCRGRCLPTQGRLQGVPVSTGCCGVAAGGFTAHPCGCDVDAMTFAHSVLLLGSFKAGFYMYLICSVQ